MKKLSTLLILLSTTGLLLAAPSTPITRGRLTTDLDAAGHSITNGPMATTNFVWEVVGNVTNNLPQGGGITTNDVRAIVADEGFVKLDADGDVTIGGNIYADELMLTGGINATGTGAFESVTTGDINAGGDASIAGGLYVGGNASVVGALTVGGHGLGTAAYRNANQFATATNLSPLAVSATVGDLVDSVNAIIGALHE